MRSLLLSTLLCAILWQTGCKANYPNCEADSDCPGHAEGREFCVNGKCQACRPTGNDCGPGKACNAGRCEAVPGWCGKHSDCPSGLCEQNRCVACKNDGGCPAGGRCNAGRCEPDNRKACKTSDECAETEDCIAGRCTPASGKRYGADQCNLQTIYFGSDQYDLSSVNTPIVDADAECIKKVGRPVNVIGYTDPRGTVEYNLSLSEKRAQAVKRRLRDLGISESNLATVPRGELDASGSDESSWEKDRRVEVTFR